MKRIIYQPKEFKSTQLESVPLSFYTPIVERKEQPIPVADVSSNIESEEELESKVDRKDTSPLSFYLNYTPTTPPITSTTIQTKKIQPIVEVNQTPVKKQRGVTTYKSNDIDVGNLRELISRFEDAGISLRVTSGKRSGATKQGNKSHHNTGDAIDITPGNGETYQSMIDKLKANSELTDWMKAQGWGILDETNPEMKKRTGATGDHWHIGKDKIAQSGLLALIGRNGLKIPIFKTGKSIKRNKEEVTLENVDRENNEALNKYKGTKYDPLEYFGQKFDGDLQGTTFILNDLNLRESNDNETYDYFKSYVNSPGFQRIKSNQSKWWKERHPYKKLLDFGNHLKGINYLQHKVNNTEKPKMFELDLPKSYGVLTTSNNNIYIGTIPDEWPSKHTIAHELAHAYNQFDTVYPRFAEGEALEQNTNTEPGHDSKNSEKHADVWGLKYLLYKEGIYDSRSNEDVTPEQIKTLREKYPEYRPLLQMSDDQAAWMLNHVASNNNNINLDNLG